MRNYYLDIEALVLAREDLILIGSGIDEGNSLYNWVLGKNN
jgi:hypothetical protein